MKKNINLPAISLVFKLWMFGIDKKDIFKKIPQDPNGPEYTYDEFCEDFALLEECAHMIFEDRFKQSLPEVEIPSEPEPVVEPEKPEYNTVKEYNLKDVAGNNKKFTWLPKTGSYYGQNIKVYFPESGDFMIIRDGAITQGGDGSQGHNQMFWFCGTDPRHNKMQGRASVFGPPNAL